MFSLWNYHQEQSLLVTDVLISKRPPLTRPIKLQKMVTVNGKLIEIEIIVGKLC